MEHQKSPNRLYRNRKKGRISGVCAGVAEYFNLNVFWLRVITIVSCFLFFFPTVLIYFLLGFILEDKPKDLYVDKEHDHFWRGVRSSPSNTLHELKHRFMSMEAKLRNMEAYVTSKEYQFDRELNKGK